jgi:hypothetical protein
VAAPSVSPSTVIGQIILTKAGFTKVIAPILGLMAQSYKLQWRELPAFMP